MRLIDLIQRQDTTFPRNLPVIVADDVWRTIDLMPDEKCQWRASDFPIISPPFPLFMVEARASEPIAGLPFIAGLVFEDVTERAVEWQVQTFFPYEGVHAPRPAHIPAGRWRPAGTRWILRCLHYASIMDRIAVFPGHIYLHIGQNGEWLDHPNHLSIVQDDVIARRYRMTPQQINATNNLAVNCLPFCLKTISLLHCRNVALAQVVPVPDKVQRRKERKRKNPTPPAAPYFILNLYPGRAVKKRPDHTALPGEGKGRPMTEAHLRRGSWATYTADKPLLGKSWGVGMFYRPAVAVGGNPQKGKRIVVHADTQFDSDA